MTGWPSGNILDFRARLPERNGAKPGVRGFLTRENFKVRDRRRGVLVHSDEIMNSYNSFVLGAENIK